MRYSKICAKVESIYYTLAILLFFYCLTGIHLFATHVGAAGGCELVKSILGMHEDNVVIERDCIEIMMHLSLSPNNSVKVDLSKYYVYKETNKEINYKQMKVFSSGFYLHVCLCVSVSLCVWDIFISKSI